MNRIKILDLGYWESERNACHCTNFEWKKEINIMMEKLRWAVFLKPVLVALMLGQGSLDSETFKIQIPFVYSYPPHHLNHVVNLKMVWSSLTINNRTCTNCSQNNVPVYKTAWYHIRLSHTAQLFRYKVTLTDLSGSLFVRHYTCEWGCSVQPVVCHMTNADTVDKPVSCVSRVYMLCFGNLRIFVYNQTYSRQSGNFIFC